MELEIEEVSRLLFGRALRLPIAAWIRAQIDGASFYQQELAEGVGAHAQYMRSELDMLCALGMIVREPKARGERRQFYVADRSHPLWSIVDTAMVAIERLSPESNVRSI